MYEVSKTKQKYKIWKKNDNVAVPLKTLQRWKYAKNSATSLNVSNLNLPSMNEIYEDVNMSEENSDDEDMLVNEDDNINENMPNCGDDDDTLSQSCESDDENFRSEDSSSSFDTASTILEELLYEGAEVTTDQCILSIMELYVDHKLTQSSLKCILRVLQLLLPKPNNAPKTLFQLFEFAKNKAEKCTVIQHYYCKKCTLYCGTLSLVETCISCSSKDGASCFYEFDIGEQIRYLFEHRNLFDKLHNFSSEDPNLITDINDGSEYKRVNSGMRRQLHDLTLILNTDGLSLVKSSKSHCWPLMFFIAELPQHLRQSHLITTGLWYDKNSKPLMNTFLQPFCVKINKYFHEGINWTHPRSKILFNSKIVAPLFIADAPARAQIQNIMNFNGIYGCNLCEIGTKTCKKVQGLRNIRIYPFQEQPCRLRSENRMEQQARKTLEENKKHVKGVKGRSIVTSLPLVDVATCVMPEYMHSCLLGVCKQFINLWINKKGPWNIKDSCPDIDEFLLNIRPPHSFHRMPRRITHSKFYKAYEYFNWILFYSIPSLIDILPKKYFQHWLLLVMALFTLLKDSITIKPELEQAEICLRLFVREIESLYSDREYTYNIHQLLHLGLCVRRWGPLWATSAFPFENHNGYIANCVHGTKHLGQEIINHLKIAQGVQVLKNICGNLEYNISPNLNREVNSYELLGAASRKESILLLNEEQQLIESKGWDWNRLNIFTRAKIENELYTSQLYKITKTNTSTVEIKFDANSVYGSIRFFVEMDNDLYFMFQHYSIVFTKIIFHEETHLKIKHILPIKEENSFTIVKVKNLNFISSVIRVGDYICKPPNKFKNIL